MMAYHTTQNVPSLHPPQIELPIIKHHTNNTVIAVRRCDGFRQLTDPIFVVIIWFAKKVTHLASLRAHLRMQTTIPDSLLSVHQHQLGLFLTNESPVHPWGHRSLPMLFSASISPHHCWMAFVQHHSIPNSIWWSAFHTASLPEYSLSRSGCVFLGNHLDQYVEYTAITTNDAYAMNTKRG